MTTVPVTCPCCLLLVTELRVIPRHGWIPDELVCNECFIEFKDVEDETEWKDLAVAPAAAL